MAESMWRSKAAYFTEAMKQREQEIRVWESRIYPSKASPETCFLQQGPTSYGLFIYKLINRL
jgi:hypothetical protein